MTISGKILATHLNRQAVVYLRQSTTKQVQQNRESAFNQRALTERLRDLGWPERQIQVIDEDQGRSGTETSVREGFQKLVADVGFRKVGIVMGYEVSRLSRNLRRLASVARTMRRVRHADRRYGRRLPASGFQ